MATIEERAATITVEVIAAMVQVIEHKDAETINGIKKYIVRELEKQRKIDIENVRRFLMDNCMGTTFTSYDLKRLIKAMEE